MSGSRVISFSGSQVLSSRVLKFSSSQVLGFLGFWVLGLSSSGEPCCTLKLKLRKIIKKVEKKKKIQFFKVYFTWPGLPKNTRNTKILGQGGSGLAHFMVRFFRSRILYIRKSGAGQDIRFFRSFAHVSLQ
jgi:hypothetical protein